MSVEQALTRVSAALSVALAVTYGGMTYAGVQQNAAAEAALSARVEAAVTATENDTAWLSTQEKAARVWRDDLYTQQIADQKAAEKAAQEAAEKAAQKATEKAAQEAAEKAAQTQQTQQVSSTPTYTVEPASGVFYATTALNIRTGPGTTYSKVGSLAYAQSVTVTGKADGWYRIGDNQWVSGSFLSTDKPVSTNTDTNTNTTRATSTVADAVAARYGLTVRYVAQTECGSVSDGTTFWGCYSSRNGGGGYIEITENALEYPTYVGLADLAAHEVSHALIMRTCGTMRPVIAGARYENVTDAYAQFFVGATTSDAGGYGYTDADAEIAKQIHAGVCE